MNQRPLGFTRRAGAWAQSARRWAAASAAAAAAADTSWTVGRRATPRKRLVEGNPEGSFIWISHLRKMHSLKFKKSKFRKSTKLFDDGYPPKKKPSNIIILLENSVCCPSSLYTKLLISGFGKQFEL